jgi:hypothetical protein
LWASPVSPHSIAHFLFIILYKARYMHLVSLCSLLLNFTQCLGHNILFISSFKGCNFETIHKTIILLHLLHLEKHSVWRWNPLTTCRHISGFPAVRKPEEYGNRKSLPMGRQYEHVVYSRGGPKFSIRFSSPRCVASRLYFKQQQRREDIN